MPSIYLLSRKIPYAKRWLRLFIDRDIGTHTFEGSSFFTRDEQLDVKRFTGHMDKTSYRCSKARKADQSSKIRKTNKSARRRLERTGKRLFKVIKKATEAPISDLDSIGEYGGHLTLHVDERTRRFPWELAFDGNDFLCTEFAVGRKVVNPPYEYMPQPTPLYKDALVIGLNYDWSGSKAERLYHCVSEARSASTQLENLHYKVHLFTGEEATVEAIMNHLKKGVSVFHFTGHGSYRTHAPAGKRGALSLADGYLTAEDLRNCFGVFGGAPYLSFLNACQTAKEIYSSGLVDSFVDLGAENVVGTFWSVFDEPSKVFARSFYKSIAQGESIGWATKKARDKLIHGRKVEEATTWPAFVLYGDPSRTVPNAP